MHSRTEHMYWLSDLANAALIAGVVALTTSVVVTNILTIRKARHDLNLEFGSEGVAKAILMDRNCRYRTFRAIKYHLCGFTDDELRKILVRAGGIRFTAGEQEVWGLFSRNRKYLCVDEIKEAPTSPVTFDPERRKSQPQQAIEPQDEAGLARDPSEAFERVRAEMMKLGKLECIKT